MTTLEHILANRDALVAALTNRLAVVRDYTRGVAGRDYTGLYLYGPPGTAKTHTVTTLLEAEFPDRYAYQRGHLTPMGLFELIGENADKVIVLDDLGAVLESKVALQILLSALEHPTRRDGGRVVKYRRMGEERRVQFYGGIVCISNLVLHDADLLGAFKSRVQLLKYEPPDDQLGALMLSLADRGWPFGSPRLSVPPPAARAVAEFVIGEMLRVGCRFDLRLFVAKALPVYRQWKKGGTESHWEELVRASVEEQLATGPETRAGRLANERAIALAIQRQYATRGERLRAWSERTGRSDRAFYRRLGE